MLLNCFCGYKMMKRNRTNLQIGEAANFGAGNSNMAFVIEIDAFLIKYQKVSYRNFQKRQSQKNIKIDGIAIFGAGNSNMAFHWN